MAKLRIGLTISGAISLGAYEGGGLAALLVAVQEMRGAVVVDAITGASAGAITSVLTARCLVRGCDPVEAMKTSWVDLPDLKRLKARDRRSPLSAEVLADGARELLGTGAGGLTDGPPEKQQAEEVRLALTMASLGGYHYRIKALEQGTVVGAITYVDWAEFRLRRETSAVEWGSAAEMALASAANAIGFPPKLVKRSAEDIERARRAGVMNPPDPNGAWYTDGGTVDNEPFGRLLDLLGDDDVDRRLLILVHPTPTRTPRPSLWTDPNRQPRWTRTGLRANNIKGEQSIYDDLRRLEKTNTRLLWTREASERIAAMLERVSTAESRAAIRAELEDIIDDLQEKHVTLNRQIERSDPEPETRIDGGEDLADLLTTVIRRATGLAGKRPVNVEVVTPDLDPSSAPADQLLAGERLGHFFGFLDVKFRRSDFALGYRNMQVFLKEVLPKYGVSAEIGAALPHVQRRYDELGWDSERWGDADWGKLSLGQRLRLFRVGGHAVNIVQDDVRHWGAARPAPTEENRG
jgi:predicted acylesterase/phospholipase RssA